MSNKIRKPAVAGMFYPDNSNELKSLITSLLEENKPTKSFNDVVGIVAPHAGYIYSGKSAAVAYNVLKDNSKFETAIVLSPSHHEFFNGCSIYDGDYYQTPLGDISINRSLSGFIVESGEGIVFSEQGHGEEHALEVQLPFLQMINNNFNLIPIVIGNQNANYLQELSKILSELVDEKTVIIASSDLSHFHSKEKAKALDNVVINRINNFEYPELYSDLAKKNCEACGGGAIVTLMETADIIGKNRSEVLSYTDSGDVSGDISNVVGYLSAVIYGEE